MQNLLLETLDKSKLHFYNSYKIRVEENALAVKPSSSGWAYYYYYCYYERR